MRTAGQDSSPVLPRVSDLLNGCGVRECIAQPALLAAPCRMICNGFVCVADSYTLHMRTAGWNQHRYNLVSGMRKCDVQPALLVASCHIICNGYVCVADSYKLHMRLAGWTQQQYNLVSVLRERYAVCVNAMRSPLCLLHPATLYVMATFV